MPLDLSKGYATADTLITEWANAIGAHFQDGELGPLLGRALTSKGVRSLGTLRERRRDEVTSIMQEHAGLGVYLVDELEKLAAYSIVEAFCFPASVADDDGAAAKKKQRVQGGGRAISFEECRGTYPDGYNAKRDINCLPVIIVSELPTAKLLDTTSLPKVTSAVAAYMFLRFGTVHYAHPDEGNIVRDTLLQIARLIVERGYKVQFGTKKIFVVLEAAPAVQRILDAMHNKLVQTKQMVREHASHKDYTNAKKPRTVFSITAAEAASRKELLDLGFAVAYPVNNLILQDHDLSSTVEQSAAAAPEPAPQPWAAPVAPVAPTAAGGGAWGDRSNTQSVLPITSLGLPPRAPHMAPAAATAQSPVPAAAPAPTRHKGAGRKKATAAETAAPATATATATATAAGKAFKESALAKSGKYTVLEKEEVAQLSRDKKDVMDFKGYGAKNIRVAVLWSGADWYSGFFNHLDRKKVVITVAAPDKMWVGWCDGDDPRCYDLEMSEYDGVTPDASWVLLTTDEPTTLFGVF